MAHLAAGCGPRTASPAQQGSAQVPLSSSPLASALNGAQESEAALARVGRALSHRHAEAFGLFRALDSAQTGVVPIKQAAEVLLSLDAGIEVSDVFAVLHEASASHGPAGSNTVQYLRFLRSLLQYNEPSAPLPRPKPAAHQPRRGHAQQGSSTPGKRANGGSQGSGGRTRSCTPGTALAGVGTSDAATSCDASAENDASAELAAAREKVEALRRRVAALEPFEDELRLARRHAKHLEAKLAEAEQAAVAADRKHEEDETLRERVRLLEEKNAQQEEELSSLRGLNALLLQQSPSSGDERALLEAAVCVRWQAQQWRTAECLRRWICAVAQIGRREVEKREHEQARALELLLEDQEMRLLEEIKIERPTTKHDGTRFEGVLSDFAVHGKLTARRQSLERGSRSPARSPARGSPRAHTNGGGWRPPPVRTSPPMLPSAADDAQHAQHAQPAPFQPAQHLDVQCVQAPQPVPYQSPQPQPPAHAPLQPALRSALHQPTAPLPPASPMQQPLAPERTPSSRMELSGAETPLQQEGSAAGRGAAPWSWPCPARPSAFPVEHSSPARPRPSTPRRASFDVQIGELKSPRRRDVYPGSGSPRMGRRPSWGRASEFVINSAINDLEDQLFVSPMLCTL